MRISDRVARRDNLDFSCLRRMDAYIVRSLLFGPFCAVFTAAVTFTFVNTTRFHAEWQPDLNLVVIWSVCDLRPWSTCNFGFEHHALALSIVLCSTIRPTWMSWYFVHREICDIVLWTPTCFRCRDGNGATIAIALLCYSVVITGFDDLVHCGIHLHLRSWIWTLQCDWDIWYPSLIFYIWVFLHHMVVWGWYRNSSHSFCWKLCGVGVEQNFLLSIRFREMLEFCFSWTRCYWRTNMRFEEVLRTRRTVYRTFVIIYFVRECRELRLFTFGWELELFENFWR